MKHSIYAMKFSVLIAIASFILASCVNQIRDIEETDDKATVQIYFSGFDPLEDSVVTTRATQSAAEAGINRIALSVFDKDKALVYSTTRNSSVDTEDFDVISCTLLPGNYTFVAVAHKASADNEESAAITSATQASITTVKVLRTFAVQQEVTVVADSNNKVSIAFGQRITSTFRLCTTDDTPSEVASCEVLVNPSAPTTNVYTFNPSTGFVPTTHQYRVEFLKSNTGNSFKNVTLSTQCFVTSSEQKVSVTINMKDASGNVVKTRTLSNVSLHPHRVTQVTGSFFHASSNGSFTFDTSDDPMIEIDLW